MSILPYALGLCLVAITLSMFLCLIRLVMGPSIVDRLLALDTLFLNATCLIIILGIYWASTSLFEGALLVDDWCFFHAGRWNRYGAPSRSFYAITCTNQSQHTGTGQFFNGRHYFFSFSWTFWIC